MIIFKALIVLSSTMTVVNSLCNTSNVTECLGQDCVWSVRFFLRNDFTMSSLTNNNNHRLALIIVSIKFGPRVLEISTEKLDWNGRTETTLRLLESLRPETCSSTIRSCLRHPRELYLYQILNGTSSVIMVE